jgi:hypothetical protein
MGEKKFWVLLGMLWGEDYSTQDEIKSFFAVQWGLNDTGNDKYLFHL